jgi:hypothetical protein
MQHHFGGNVAFPATMSTLKAYSDGFVAATAKVPPYQQNDVEPGLWLVDSNASHYITNVLRDFHVCLPISLFGCKVS